MHTSALHSDVASVLCISMHLWTGGRKKEYLIGIAGGSIASTTYMYICVYETLSYQCMGP
jgi:hypothetical protein